MTGQTELGVFARVFPPGAPAHVAAAVRRAGFTLTQLNLSALGRPTLDPDLTPEQATDIRRGFESERVAVWSLSATFNAIDPDVLARKRSITAAKQVIDVAKDTGAQVVTLCSGTRDPVDMWRAHPDNGTLQAWQDLRATLDELLPSAAAAGVRLGIEPEAANVVCDAPAAAQLLDDLGEQAQHVGIVLDPANLLTPETAGDQKSILTEAFALLGEHVVGMHAKDVLPGGFAAPGTGALDYALVSGLHSRLPRPVPVIAQDLSAEDAPRVHDFLARYWPRS